MTAATNLNAQYNLTSPDGLAAKTAAKMRIKLFKMFMDEFRPSPSDTVLDIGATSDQTYSSSNYFEAMYPHKNRITAAGIDDASFLERQYPGVKFEFADARALQFDDGSFDFVHSSAVIEHVGSIENQAKMISECARVARKGVWLTTPNRWFPVEFHTSLPLVHWLPKPAFRSLLTAIGQPELAKEEHLNLMDRRGLLDAAGSPTGWSFSVVTTKLVVFDSNLVLVGRSTAYLHR